MDKKCHVFYPMHKAVQIQLMQNGDVLTKIEKKEFFLQSNNSSQEGPQQEDSKTIASKYDKVKMNDGMVMYVTKETETMFFRSKSVVIANGGEQVLHPQFFNWFPKMAETEESKARVITSDYFLKKDGFISTIRKLSQLP